MQKLPCSDVGNLGFSRLCKTSFILCLGLNWHHRADQTTWHTSYDLKVIATVSVVSFKHALSSSGMHTLDDNCVRMDHEAMMVLSLSVLIVWSFGLCLCVSLICHCLNVYFCSFVSFRHLKAAAWECQTVFRCVLQWQINLNLESLSLLWVIA